MLYYTTHIQKCQCVKLYIIKGVIDNITPFIWKYLNNTYLEFKKKNILVNCMPEDKPSMI